MTKKILLSLGLILAGFLAGFYIFQLNSLTTLVWHTAEAERQLIFLKHQNTALQTKAYQALSLGDLEEIARLRNFEKITTITYVRLSDGLVAKNQ